MSFIFILLIIKKKATQLCIEFSSLCLIATVLEGLFGEYHSSSAALGQQCPESPGNHLYVIGWQPRNAEDVKTSFEIQRDIRAGTTQGVV